MDCMACEMLGKRSRLAKLDIVLWMVEIIRGIGGITEEKKSK